LQTNKLERYSKLPSNNPIPPLFDWSDHELSIIEPGLLEKLQPNGGGGGGTAAEELPSSSTAAGGGNISPAQDASSSLAAVEG
jgi:hypothetical protein